MVIIIAVVAAIAALVIIHSRDGMHVRALGSNDLTQSTAVSDYKDSRLHLYKNGTFTVEVICVGEKEFTGIGTYVKNGKDSYTFTYADVWFRVGSDFVRSGDTTYIDQSFTYEIKSGRIEFQSQNSQFFYFK